MKVERQAKGGGRSEPRDSAYVVEYLDWTDEQQREWIRGMAQLCVRMYNRRS